MFKAIAVDSLKQCNFSTRWCATYNEALFKIQALAPKNDRYTIEVHHKDGTITKGV